MKPWVSRSGVEGDGVFAGTGWEEVILGDRHQFQLSERPLYDGAGVLRIIVHGLSQDGLPLYMRRIDIHGLIDDDGIWASASSLTDAKLKRLGALKAEKRLSEAEEQQILDDLLTARSQEAPPGGSEPRSTTAHARKLQQVFDRLVPTTNPTPVERAHQVAPGDPVTLTVSGTAQWTDSGNMLHPIPMAVVEIRDEELIGSDLVTTVTSDAAGNFTATFTHDDGALQGDPDIFVRVLARSAVADVQPDGSGKPTDWSPMSRTRCPMGPPSRSISWPETLPTRKQPSASIMRV